VGWWVAGAVLALGLMWSAWDVGRPGRASGGALLVMRSVGGLGLLAMAAHALDTGATVAAGVAAAAALPLIAGLFRRPAARRRGAESGTVTTPSAASAAGAGMPERRAA
jgi:hypothetical protein